MAGAFSICLSLKQGLRRPHLGCVLVQSTNQLRQGSGVGRRLPRPFWVHDGTIACLLLFAYPSGISAPYVLTELRRFLDSGILLGQELDKVEALAKCGFFKGTN